MEDRFDDRSIFSRFLNRSAAEKDLRVRERLASIRGFVADAPLIRPLSKLWIGQDEAPIGGWISDIAELDHPRSKLISSWAFWGISFSDGLDFHKLRKVKLKVDKPFVISVSEPDDYQLHQLRALGGDAVFLPVSHKEVVEIQYLTEVCRDLGMEMVLSCDDFASLEKIGSIDARFLSCPLSLRENREFKKTLGQKLPIFYLESLAEIERLSEVERPFGVLLDDRILDHSPHF